MKTVIDCLALVMTLWMLYCFVRHGIYPAIRLVLRMIGAIARLFARQPRGERSHAVTEHVAEVSATPLMVAPSRQQTNYD